MKISEFRGRLKASNGVIIGLVYVILMIDTILMTAVVPVLPGILGQNNATESKVVNGTCVKANESHAIDMTTLHMAVLLASKPLVQAFANLAVGPLVDRIGFSVPILFGCLIMCGSAFLYTFGVSFALMLTARAIQGVGSASASVSGIAMLADRYSEEDDEKRGKAIGIGFGGLAMGVLIGPTFGSVVNQVAGKEAVFLVLAVAAALLAVVVAFVNGIRIEGRSQIVEPIPLTTLLRDPYVFLASIGLMLGTFAVAAMEAAMPIWMKRTMCAEKWQLGVAFLPTSISYLVTVNAVALCLQKLPRWFTTMIGLFFIAGAAVGLPFARSFWELLPPGVVLGCGVGLVDASIFPMLAAIVDSRYRAVYGTIYAIGDLAFCVSFVIGPIFAGLAVGPIGFDWVMRTIAIAVFVFSPFLLFFKKLSVIAETSEETARLIKESDSLTVEASTPQQQYGSIGGKDDDTRNNC